MRQFETVNFQNFSALQQWAKQSSVRNVLNASNGNLVNIFYGRNGQINSMRCRTGIPASFNFLHYILVVKNKPKRNVQIKSVHKLHVIFHPKTKRQNIFRKSCSLQVKNSNATKKRTAFAVRKGLNTVRCSWQSTPKRYLCRWLLQSNLVAHAQSA